MTDWDAKDREREAAYRALLERNAHWGEQYREMAAMSDVLAWLQLTQLDAWAALLDRLNIAQPALPPGAAAGFPTNRSVEPTPAGTGAVAGPAGEVRPDSSNPSPVSAGESGHTP